MTSDHTFDQRAIGTSSLSDKGRVKAGRLQRGSAFGRRLPSPLYHQREEAMPLNDGD